MKRIEFKNILLILAVLVSLSPTTSMSPKPQNLEELKLFPYTYDFLPELPSPHTMSDGTEVVVTLTLGDDYRLCPVTIENGEPLDYKNRLWWNKGQQLKVNAADFPTLARTGLHSKTELEKTKTITGRAVEDITQDGRPERFSLAGFMSHDEDIISVLKGDNKLVTHLGLTHPQLARPLFHVFNVILCVKTDSQRGNVGGLLYNHKKIHLKFQGSKGWQKSIFNDEILGNWRIEIWRELDKKEKAFIDEKYAHLNEEEKTDLISKLSYIFTGEMVPYYVMRYGFYEGHTDYRADPIAIAFIFGLKTLEEIEAAFPGKIYEALTTHSTN